MAERPQLAIISYTQGSYIVIEGKKDMSTFFIIQKGSVQLSSAGGALVSDDSHLLGPGDFFGVVAAMSDHAQVETAIAVTDVVLVAVRKSQFEGLIQFNTPIAIKIIRQFSRRVRQMNNALTEITMRGENPSGDTNILFRNAKYYEGKKDYGKMYYCYKRYVECYPGAPDAGEALRALKTLEQYNRPAYRAINGAFMREYKKDTLICSEGELGDEMYIIQDGTANITSIVKGSEVILAVLKPGDIFGEMALLESKPRSAGAVTLENCTVMVVNKKNFETMADTRPQLIARLTQVLSDRIWFSYRQLENAKIKDPAGRFFDLLVIEMEKDKAPFVPFTAYIYNYNILQLMKMANVPDSSRRDIMAVIGRNKSLKMVSDRMMTSDVMEVVKLAEYYKKQSRGR